MSTPLPKLSYVLLSHNREKYIRAAIESAFAQDYEGELEYIFSDDCSTDRTFEIIKECVAEYKGNRRVVVTQTPENLHLAGNTNHAVQFVESDWVIRADDDDLSSCSRCSIIGNAIARHPDVKFIATSYINYTEQEEDLILEQSLLPVVDINNEGICSIRDNKVSPPKFDYSYYFKAWHIDIYHKFGPLPEKANYVDDLICYYRGCVLGESLYINSKPLVFARIDSGNQSVGGVRRDKKDAESVVIHELFLQKYYNQSLAPMQKTAKLIIDYVKQHYTEEQTCCASFFLTSLRIHVNELADMSLYWERGFLYRWQTAKRYSRMSLFLLIRCFPLPIYARILSFARMIKHLIK